MRDFLRFVTALWSPARSNPQKKGYLCPCVRPGVPARNMFWYSVICLLPFSVCLMWTVLLLLDGRKLGWKSGRGPLCLFSAACTLLYLCHAIHFIDNPGPYSWIDVLYSGLNLTVYPLFFLYLRSVADVKGIRPADWLLLLPAAGVTVYAACVHILGLRPDTVLLCNKIFFPLTVVFTLVFGEILLTRYDKAVRNFYVETEKKTLEGIHLILWLLAVTSVASGLASFLGREAFQSRIPLLIPSLLFSALLYALLYAAFRLPFTAQDLQRDMARSSEALEDAGAAPDASDAADDASGRHAELVARIEEIVREREIYKQHGLTITDLAALVGTNRTYVSNAINQHLGMSFSDYINRLRIEESKRIIRAAEGRIMMSAVAEESGFVSEATFYRHFRSLEGKTPLEWWQSQPHTAAE